MDHTKSATDKLVSMVIPLYNEEDNVEALYQELCALVDRSGLRAEFVFVNDGSKDKTVERLTEVVEGDSRVVLVNFRRNFGQTAAMAAGFDFATGDYIVTLDGDLQNDPAEVPAMIRKLEEEDLDLVAGWRKHRKDKMISRKIPSMIANKIISKITKVNLHDYGCTLKVMKSEVAKNIQLYGEMHRFIPALAAELGVKFVEFPVNHRPRVAGVSKYGISRTFRVILDLLTVKFFLGYSTRPLHLFGMLGLSTGGVGFLTMGVLIFQRLFMSTPLSNRPLLLLSSLLVLVGLQFLCFGLLAEILVRTYHESQNKKIYAVREIVRFNGNETNTIKVNPRKFSVVTGS